MFYIYIYKKYQKKVHTLHKCCFYAKKSDK